MRGASSSHCAAALRIGRLARDLMCGEIAEVLVEFCLSGSLPTTHQSQGSDMGLFGGLLGWDAADERLQFGAQALADAGIEVKFAYRDFGDLHPNTYRLTLTCGKNQRSLIAISTGGGMIELLSLDGCDLRGTSSRLDGGCYIWIVNPNQLDELELAGLVSEIETIPDVQNVWLAVVEDDSSEKRLFVTSTNSSIFTHQRKPAGLVLSPENCVLLEPVLPVLSPSLDTRPFRTCSELLMQVDASERRLSDFAVEYEMARGQMTEDEVRSKMIELIAIWRRSMEIGLAGTNFEDRILGAQSLQYADAMRRGKLLDSGVLNRIVWYVSAMMEVKSSLGVIIAAPTAGACAALPGALLAMADDRGDSDETLVDAFLSAGLVGVFIAEQWTFAAEVGGCQAEGGAAAAMAAAALVTLAGGSAVEATNAAALALQSMLGLICDPVASRVEVPCLGKNVMAASNAVCCANMALAGYSVVIPLDEVIAAARSVSALMPRELRCTALGGLATTPSAREVERRLFQITIPASE